MEEVPKEPKKLHAYTLSNWEKLGPFYSSEHGLEGNTFHQKLVSPTAEKLLDIKETDKVLEVACGSGVFARRLCQLGARKVVATDFSQSFLDVAIMQSGGSYKNLTFKRIDATEKSQIEALGMFDKVVCNMAIMDMSELDALFAGLHSVLRQNGTFVFSVMHPCFNGMEFSRGIEEIEVLLDRNPALEYRPYLRLYKYLGWKPSWGVGMVGQPEKQLYFHRPISELCNIAFRNGFVVDALEEPLLTFDEEEIKKMKDTWKDPRRCIGWHNFTEFPMILAMRCRKT